MFFDLKKCFLVVCTIKTNVWGDEKDEKSEDQKKDEIIESVDEKWDEKGITASKAMRMKYLR